MHSLISSMILKKIYKEKGAVNSKFKSEVVKLLAAQHPVDIHIVDIDWYLCLEKYNATYDKEI